jgi:small subunit ribosomal protein S20
VILPNIKSAKKRVQVSKLQNERNRMIKSGLKTSVKKFEAAMTEDAYRAAVKTLDQAVAKGVVHKNTAARRKSQMAKKMNAAQ